MSLFIIINSLKLLKNIPRNKKSSRSEFQISKSDSGRPKLSFLDQIMTSQCDKNQKFEMSSKSILNQDSSTLD